MCDGRIGLACAHDIFPFACHTFMHFSCIRTIFFILLILNVLVLFCLSLSLSYYFDWKSTLSRNPLRSKASSSSPLANSTPSHIRIHDDKAHKDFQRTFHDMAFIRSAKSFYRIFLILTFLLSSTVRVRSHCVASRSLVLP